MYNYTCRDCGAPVQYLRSTQEPRCHICRKARKNARNNHYAKTHRPEINERDREYQREYQRKLRQREYYNRTKDEYGPERLPGRYWANGDVPLDSTRPTRVVGIAPDVRDSEEQFYLAVYVGTTWPTVEFIYSAIDGCFNGLLVEHNARRYAVRDGQLQEVGR